MTADPSSAESGPPRKDDHADIVVPARPSRMAVRRYESSTDARKSVRVSVGAWSAAYPSPEAPWQIEHMR